MEQEKIKRCAIYTRKSTEKGLEQSFNSLDNQREKCENYIKLKEMQNWQLVDREYSDGGFSGATMERPGIQRLMEDIKLGRIDIVVIYKIDRMSRSLLDFSKLIHLFNEYNVSFVSVTQEFDTSTSMGKLMLNILLSFAQFEREMISERTRDKMHAARKKGLWMGGTPPLGYDAKDKQLVINPEEAEMIQDLYENFLDTRSITDTCRYATRKGYTTKYWVSERTGKEHGGKPVNKSTLYQILRSRLYLGEVPCKGESYPGKHEPIINEKMFNRAQEIFKEPTNLRVQKKKNKVPMILKGLIKCGHCKRSFSPSHSTKRGKSYGYYICQGTIKHGYQSCPVGTLSKEPIEAFALKQIKAHMISPEIISSVMNEAKKQNRYNLNIDEAEMMEEIKKLDSIWAELFPVMQARILKLLIKQITVYKNNIEMEFDINGLPLLYEELKQGRKNGPEI